MAVLSFNESYFESCSFVCVSVCLARPALPSNSKTKKNIDNRKTKIGVNVPQGKSDQCGNFQLKRSNFKCVSTRLTSRF